MSHGLFHPNKSRGARNYYRIVAPSFVIVFDQPPLSYSTAPVPSCISYAQILIIVISFSPLPFAKRAPNSDKKLQWLMELPHIGRHSNSERSFSIASSLSSSFAALATVLLISWPLEFVYEWTSASTDCPAVRSSAKATPRRRLTNTNNTLWWAIGNDKGDLLGPERRPIEVVK